MAALIDTGTWVEIRRVVLAAGERAPRVPADTQAVALEMRVKGFLMAPAALGQDAVIETAAGRRLRGALVAADPAYTHSFGRCFQKPFFCPARTAGVRSEPGRHATPWPALAAGSPAGWAEPWRNLACRRRSSGLVSRRELRCHDRAEDDW